MLEQNANIKTKSALIVGCGYVGSKLLRYLHKAGWKVHGIRRKQSNNPQILSVDISASFSILGSYDIIFYMISADKYDSESYQNAYVTGVTNTLTAIRESKKTPRFIFVSSTSLFSENNGGTVDESSQIEKFDFSKKYLAQGEALVAESGLSYCIVRFSGIYGPGRCQMINSIKDQTAKQKLSPCISNRIYIDDCVGVLSHIANLKNSSSLYIASDCEPTPYNEVLRWLSRHLEMPEPPLEDKPSKTTHISNKRCSNARLLASGYHFKKPSFREGFKSCV